MNIIEKEYPKLTAYEREAYYTKINQEWRLFIQRKKKEKNVRFLLNQDFLYALGTISFVIVTLLENPFYTTDTRFRFDFDKNEYGIGFIEGRLQGDFTLYNRTGYYVKTNHSFAEIEFFKSLLEEFGMKDILMNMDSGRWKGMGT